MAQAKVKIKRMLIKHLLVSDHSQYGTDTSLPAWDLIHV